MAGRYNLTIADYGNERSTFGVWLPTLNSGNIGAQTTLVGELKTAVDGITIGSNIAYSLIASQVQLSGSPAGSVYAQRENKWLVSWTDTVNGHPGTNTIPTADLSKLLPNSDQADLTDAAMIAFIAAFEAVAQSNTGHSVSVNGIRFVGRNL